MFYRLGTTRHRVLVFGIATLCGGESDWQPVPPARVSACFGGLAPAGSAGSAREGWKAARSARVLFWEMANQAQRRGAWWFLGPHQVAWTDSGATWTHHTKSQPTFR